MQELFSGTLDVQYGQFYIEAGALFDGDMAKSFVGQSNGLCGAAVPGFLFFVTGLHSGPVGLVITLHDGEPPLAQDAEDVVEVSLQVTGSSVFLVQWSEAEGRPLARMAGSYRARYSGANMDKAHAEDTNLTDEPIDHYRLEFWPASPAPDQVIRQGSDVALYWHDWARGLAAG